MFPAFFTTGVPEKERKIISICRNAGQNMKVKEINHITINMKDIEKSLDFYGRVMGLEKLEEVNMGDHYIRYFALPGGAKLELLEYFYETKAAQYTEVDAGVYRHLALEVDDIHAAAEELKKEGLKILVGPDKAEKLGCYFMLFEDPNGVQLEFTQKY